MGGGESNLPTSGPPASLFLHLASSSVTPAGSDQKSQGKQRGAYVGAVEVMCVGVRGGAVVMDVI